MRVADRWTTQHGSWDVNPANHWGIDQAHRDKYLAGRDIPGAGADHHIMVMDVLGPVYFKTSNSIHYVGDRAGDWVNFPMSRDASYSTERGEVGPWQVWINGQKMAEGIGMPDGEHVSTFLVIDRSKEKPVPVPSEGASYLVIKGVEVWRSE